MMVDVLPTEVADLSSLRSYPESDSDDIINDIYLSSSEDMDICGMDKLVCSYLDNLTIFFFNSYRICETESTSVRNRMKQNRINPPL